MDRVLIGAPSILAEIRRLLRFLLVETPRQAEEHFANLKELRKAQSNEQLWAIEIADDASATYIVYDHGTKYTTSIRPSHIPPEKVVRVNMLPADNRLRKRLEDRASELKEISNELFETSRIGASLDSIAFLYNKEPKNPNIRHIDVVKELGDFLNLNSDEAVRQWCTACSDRLVEAYGQYRLAGNEVIEPIATLLLFDFCPFPLATLLEMNRDYLRYGIGDKFMGVDVSMPFPVPDIKFYLAHPVVPANLAVVWGTAIAREFQHKAEIYRDLAKRQYTVEQFLAGLYLAVLYYRIALYAYRAVLSLPKTKQVTSETARSRVEEAPTEAEMCEEYRVVIETSMLVALEGTLAGLLYMPSIANAMDFSFWIAWMADPSSPVNAEFEVRQAHDAQLIMPSFLRDLALGRIACIKGDTAKGIARLQAVMGELEKHQGEAVVFGDPNYLSSTYDFMARVCAEKGMDQESAEYSRRAQPAFVQELLNRPGAFPMNASK